MVVDIVMGQWGEISWEVTIPRDFN